MGDNESHGAAERRARLTFWIGVGGVMLVALLLRVWGVRHGMPFAYNTDENAHFVPRAIGMFGHDLNPRYFVNPPAFTYVLHIVFAVVHGGRESVSEAFAVDPASVWVPARLTAAVLSTAAVGLLAVAGARLLGRREGLLAAAVLAVAVLPVYYSHLALNDAVLLAPVCLALVGGAGIARGARRRDWWIAGAGLGLACATKYTGGIVLIALLAAAWAGHGKGGVRSARDVRIGIATAAGVAVAAFVIANPYAVLDASWFLDGVLHQSDASADAAGKLGQAQTNGWLFYLGAMTWGVGWVPALAAIFACSVLLGRDRRMLAVLALPVVLFVAFMGAQERYFGRWLMPVLPMVCLLAAVGGGVVIDALARRFKHRRALLVGGVAALLAGQGLVASIHLDGVLSRQDTRNELRTWMVRSIPPGRKVVIEPFLPAAWAQDVGVGSRTTASGDRWLKWPTSRSPFDPDTGRRLPGGAVVGVEDYVKTLRPELLDDYVRGSFCWVVVASHQRGRAEAEPGRVPAAIAYYRRLDRESRVAARFRPWDEGAGAVKFSFDRSFVPYPLAYERPGPEITVHRLRRGFCGAG